MVPQEPDADDLVDRLLDQVFATHESQWIEALDQACADHPEAAGAIRQRAAQLRRAGLLQEHAPQPVGSGSRLGRFTLGALLGDGGMGSVYRATSADDDQTYAVKVLRAQLRDRQIARERMAREATLACAVRHRHVCPVLAADVTGEVPYLVMPLVSGESLAQRLRRDPESLSGSPAAVRRTVAWFARLAEGLGALHLAGVVHRDVKPANILVDHEGEPVLVDFGLADGADQLRLTLTGTPLGTPCYMPPEQVRGAARVTASADVYGLGVSLYECLAHRPPFLAGDRDSLYRAILNDPPPDPRRVNPHVPRPLWAILWRCLEKAPLRRYPTGTELARDLHALCDGNAVSARLPGPARQATAWITRHPVLALLILAATLALALGVALVREFRRQARARAILIASESRALDQLNPTAAALLAREAWRASPDFDTRTRLLAALANLAQIAEVDCALNVGWAAPSPDGSRLAIGVGPTREGQRLAPEVIGPWRRVLVERGHAGAWSPDGANVAVAANSGSVVLCDARAGTRMELSLPAGIARSLRLFGPIDVLQWTGPEQLAVADRTGQIHRIVAGKLVDTVKIADQPVRALHWLPEDHRRLLAVMRSGERRWLGAADVEPQRGPPEQDQDLTSSACSGDRSWLVLGLRSGAVCRARTTVGAPLEQLFLVSGTITGVAVDATGNTVAAVSDMRSLHVWRNASVQTRTQSFSSVPNAVAVNANGTIVAAGENAGAIRLFDRDTRPLRTLYGHRNHISGLLFVDGGRHLLSHSHDGTVRLWNLQPEDFQVLAGIDGAIFGADWLADGAHLVAAEYGGRVLVFDSAGARKQPLDPVNPAGRTFLVAGRDRDSFGLITEAAGPFQVLRPIVSASEPLPLAGSPAASIPGGTRGLASLPAGGWLVASPHRLTWLDHDGFVSRTREFLDSEASEIGDVAVCPRSGRIALAWYDRHLQFLDPDGESDGAPLAFGHTLTSVAWSPSDATLVVGATSGAVWRLDPRTRRRTRLPGHEGMIRRIVFSADGRWFATGAADGTARVWTAEGEPIADLQHPGIVHQVAFHPDGTRLLTAGSDGMVRIWPHPAGDLALVASRIYRDFTADERDRFRPQLR